MLIYYILFFSIILLDLSKLKYKNLCIFVILFLFSALRFDIGIDYYNYYKVIIYLDEFNYIRFGPIDRLFIDISRYLGFNQFYFIITSFIIIYFILKTLNKFSNNYLFSILLFLAIPIFYFSSFSIIRQYAAIAIVFYSLKYIVKRSILKYTILVLIASLFHASAIISFPIYFLYRKKISKTAVIGIVILSFFLSNTLLSIVQTYMPLYASHISDEARFGQSLLYFFIIILIFLIVNYKYIRNSQAEFYFNVYTIGVFLYSVSIQFGEVAPRISYYYLIFIILLIPSVLNFYKKKQAYFLIVLFSLLLYSFNFYLFDKDRDKNAYVPYKTFFLIDEKSYYWK